ncbi:MAG: glycoside hydrolase family 5 protein, partial [Draconibacterium sp.]|nr:glycoside hydrolase family 5 protein [Draconibacterium sp.]
MNSIKYILIFIFYFLGIVPFVMSQNLNTGEPSADLSAFCSKQKGFNLLGKFDVAWSNKGFKEKEFQIIKDLGFNFVRLPLDYRTYTLTGNWNYIIEDRIKNIDEAIQWGEKYNVHVCINLHRAPGYCVNTAASLPANHQLDLWTDTVAQNVFVNHWEFFANRYKDISPERLSFNLVNEPSNVSEAEYVHVMKKAIEVIHKISPDRIIFVDGLNYANEIILSLKNEPNVAQAIHCYSPFNLTHYKAGWVGGSDEWPVPKWPILWVSNFLYGPWKSEFQSALIFQHNFTKGMEIIVNVKQVSIESTLRVKADNNTIYTKNFVCRPETGVDFTKIIETQWGYQNISNKNFSVTLNETAASLGFDNS